MAATTQYLGTGRRKKSIARVRLIPGTGVITINGRDVEDYFGYETLKMIVRAPLALTDTLSKFDVGQRLRRRLYRPGRCYSSRHLPRPDHCGSRTPRRSQEGRLPDPWPQNEGKEKVRPQSSPSRSSVQQAINFIKMHQSPGKSRFNSDK